MSTMSINGSHFVGSPILTGGGGEKKRGQESELEDTFEYIKVLMGQEDAYQPPSNYLDWGKTAAPVGNDRVNEGWRRKICEWSFEVVDHFGFDREVVSIALNYLDRILAMKTQVSGEPIPRREFQLVAVTSLYLATKLHGETDDSNGPRRKLKLTAYVELSRGLFSVDTIESMEQGILEDLQWRLNPPTTVRFVDMYVKFLPQFPPNNDLPPHNIVANSYFEMARYLTELSVCASKFNFMFDLKPSLVAYSAILCAIDSLMNKIPLPYDLRLEFINKLALATSYTPVQAEVRQCKKLLKELCPQAFAECSEEPTLVRTSSVLSSPDFEEELTTTGKTSPVCVIDELQGLSPEKRRRTNR